MLLGSGRSGGASVALQEFGDGVSSIISVDVSSLDPSSTLVVAWNLRTTSASGTIAQVSFNGVTGTSYWAAARRVTGNGGVSTPGYTGSTKATIGAGFIADSTSNANAFGVGRIYIPDWSTTSQKVIFGQSSCSAKTTDPFMTQDYLGGGWHTLTDAITSIELSASVGNLTADSWVKVTAQAA